MRRMLARLGAPVCRALILLRCADAIGTGTADAAEQTARREAALSLLAQAEKAAAAFPPLQSPAATLLALGMTQARPSAPFCGGCWTPFWTAPRRTTVHPC